MTSTTPPSFEKLVKNFEFVRTLDTNPQIKTVTLLGTIFAKNAIITLEKLHFNENQTHNTAELVTDFDEVTANDVYFWSNASMNSIVGKSDLKTGDKIKINLVYPATEIHIRKYDEQKFHMIKETPEMYKSHVVPYIKEYQNAGRLNWVYNILFHGHEADRIVHNEPDQFILLPDMKWSGHDMDSLYLLAIVYRKDIASVRDLNSSHKEWLISLQNTIKRVVPEKYPQIEDASQLRIFIHYQPSYYHFHVHVVNIKHPGLRDGISVGKALLLDDVIDNLDFLGPEGYAKKNITYVLGENHPLWEKFNQ